MERNGCFEILATCAHCGQPLPVNGPLRTVVCGACLQKNNIKDEHLVDFLNDLEEEYAGLEERQGKGGNRWGGGQSFKYGYYRLAPRCKKCQKPLPAVATGTEGTVACEGCGGRFYTFPAPAWLKEKVPSAVQIISPEREDPEADGAGSEAALKLDVEAPRPVLMACPGCGGGLEITSGTERTCPCRFCGAAVFLPDELWRQLHPVPEKREWFVRFEGPTWKQLVAAGRAKDLVAEQEDLKRRGTFVPMVSGLKRRMTPAGLAMIVAGTLLIIGPPTGYLVGRFQGFEFPDWLIFPLVVCGFVLVSLASVAPSLMGARTGPLRACKKAMNELAHRLGLELDAEFENGYIGRATGKVRGREVTLDPSRDEGLEVDLHHGWTLYLRIDTRNPFHPEDCRRFTTGDARFDDMFPIRWAKPELARRLESAPEKVAPFLKYLDRWGDRLAHFEIWSDLEVHILPGGAEAVESKYFRPEDLESLLEDTVELARAVDALIEGREGEG
jgi:hypothetical protein